ncbi:MAG: rhamnan synthesis F family protein [Cyanobacteriota bacterium]|nr:rhamnan synthesis F family protein [Cyanobacteriota bacterium]
MPTTELRPNVKPDYRTDPFSLVLTASGERQRAVPAQPQAQSGTPATAATLVYHAFEAQQALLSLRWLRSCGPWSQVIVSFSGSSQDLEELDRSGLIDQLIPVANRGRNLLPLLQICRDRLPPDTPVLHLHGKQSLPAWRHQLETQLVRDPADREQHRLWLADPRHGVIAPTTFDGVRQHATWEGNFAIARDLFARAYPEQPPLSPYNLLSFPAGGMFWFRARVLQRIAGVLEPHHFPPEPLPPDRSVAHALERLVFHCCEAEGLQWAFVHQQQGTLAKLGDLPGVLDDWRDHYIELLLPRAHTAEPPSPTPSETAPSQPPLGQLKRHLKDFWRPRRNTA